MPRIPCPLEDVKHVVYCGPTRFSDVLQLVLRIRLMDVNDSLQMAPNTVVERNEIG
jgi:hypothetical protein